MNKNKKTLLKLIILIILIILTLMVTYYNRVWPFDKKNTKSVTSNSSQKINKSNNQLEKNSTKQSKEDSKSDKVFQVEQKNQKSKIKKNIGIMITGYNLDQTGQKLQIDAVALNYVENGGKCHFHLKFDDDETKEIITDVLTGPSSMSCKTINVKINQFKQKSFVKVDVQYISDNIESDKSEQVDIDLKKIRGEHE